MKDQNKSIWSSFTSSMAGPVGAHIYLKFDMVLGLDTNCPTMIYFVISLIQKGVIESFFQLVGNCPRRISQLLGIFILVVSCKSFAVNKLENGFFMENKHINLDQSRQYEYTHF